MIKKWVLLLTMAGLQSAPTWGQLIVGDVNINLLNEVRICEVVIKEGLVTRNIKVTF